MQVNIGKWSLYFGRLKNVPDRTTEIGYFNVLPFFSIGNKKSTARKNNKDTLRGFAKNGIVRRAIDLKKEGLLKLPFRFVNVDPNDVNDYKDLKSIATDIIKNPDNINSYLEFWKAILEDIIVGDCGAIEVAKGGNRPLYLFPVDGFTIEFVQGFPKETTYRYAQKQSGTNDYIYLKDDELLYIKRNCFTHTPFGLGEIESAFIYLDYLFNVLEFDNETASKGIPKFLINLGKNLTPDQIGAFRRYMENEIYGTGNIPVLAGDGIDSKQIGAINDDGLYLQYVELLIAIVAVCTNIPPSKLGVEKANDRSTVAEKNDSIIEEAIKPYARLLEDVINNKILKMLGYDKFIKFEYVFEQTETQRKAVSDRVCNEYMQGLITQNEGRMIVGYEPRQNSYCDMDINEAKASINKDYQPIKPLGNNPYDGKPTDNKTK